MIDPFGLVPFPPFDLGGSPPEVVGGPGIRPFGLVPFPPFDLAALAPPPIVSGPFEVDLLAYLEANLTCPVWYGHIPQGKPLPAVSFFGLDEEDFYTLLGPTGLVAQTHQIDIWANDFVRALTIEAAVRRLIGGYRGMIGSTRVSTSRVRNRLSLYDPAAVPRDPGTWHLLVECRFVFRKP